MDPCLSPDCSHPADPDTGYCLPCGDRIAEAAQCESRYGMPLKPLGWVDLALRVVALFVLAIGIVGFYVVANWLFDRIF